MEGKRGITLVSLVVTIIVLIILAGVSINLTLGENGIITMAKRARENMELATIEEERQLNELYMQIEQEGLSGESSYDVIAKLIEFKRQIASAITDMGIQTQETEDATTMATNIRNLTVASSADKVSYDNTNSELVATNVQGAIDEINNSLNEITEVDLEVTSLITKQGNCKVYRKNNMLTYQLIFTSDTLFNTSVQKIATIPEGFRPKTTHTKCIAYGTGTAIISITSNGEIMLSWATEDFINAESWRAIEETIIDC